MLFYLAHYRNGKPLGKEWKPTEKDDEIILLSSPFTKEETELLSEFSRWVLDQIET